MLEGPATLEIGSRTSAICKGKLTVTVENPSASGFVICTPGMKFTDLGTEFGVMVKQDGMQEVHVFRGKVQAEQAVERKGDAEIPSSRLVLTVNQAICITGPNTPFERIAFDEKRFVRIEQMRASSLSSCRNRWRVPAGKSSLLPHRSGRKSG